MRSSYEQVSEFVLRKFYSEILHEMLHAVILVYGAYYHDDEYLPYFQGLGGGMSCDFYVPY